MEISFSQRLVTSPDTLINTIGGESVILNLKSESYFGLDATATDMWSALVSSNSIQTAYELLLSRYDVSEDLLKDDLTLFVEKLIKQELVQLV